MAKAEVLIAAYVEAGYSKIHLDCSMSCADDPAVLDDEVVAESRRPPDAGRRRRGTPSRHRGADVRHRHRGAGARRRARDARQAHPDAGRPGPEDDRRASHRLRRGWAATRLAAGHGPGGAARRRVRPPARHRLRAQRHRRVAARPRRRGAPGLRGALHRLSTARAAAGAGRRPLGGPQGRARR